MIQFLSLFSGIGAFEKALDRLGVPYNLVNYCEIDKYASKSYSVVHDVPEGLNLGDITKVDTSKLPPIDIVSYGFPCQDISLAGRQKGLFNDDGTVTRSGLFFEALRIIEDTKPKVAIAENVKNLTGKKFKEQFDIVLESLEQAGYNNYWQVLNAKDYGVPQNRERVFIVSIRKDVDKGCFKFPEGFELKLRLKDLLESEVDEKYYLSKTLNLVSRENYLQWDNSGKGYNSQQNRAYYQDGLAPTLSCCNTNGDKSQIVLEDKPVLLGGVGEKNFGKQYRQGNRVYDSNAVAMCLLSQPVGNAGGNSYLYGVEDKESIFIKENTKKGYTEAIEGDSVNFEQPNSKTRRDRVGRGVAQTLTTSPQMGIVTSAAMRGRYNESGEIEQQVEVSDREYSNAITTVQKDSMVAQKGLVIDDTQGFDGTRYYDNISPSLRANRSGLKTVTGNLRIRKLTPLECWRLMGFDDEDYYKAEKVNSNTQLYKQAGNSIVVDVLVYLFKEILEAVEMKKIDDKVVVYECDKLINLEALKENEPELYEELVADYPSEKATYVFKVS